MAREEDRPPRFTARRSPRSTGDVEGSAGLAARPRAKGKGIEPSFRAKPFLLGLSYGFALGFVIEAILASHP